MRKFKIFDAGLTEDGFKYEVWKTYYMTEEAHQNHISKKNIYNSLEEIVKKFDYINLEIYEMEIMDGRASILPRVDKQLLSKVKMFLWVWRRIWMLKKIKKEATIDKVLPRKIVNKIKTTNKDDWKNYYKNLNSSINSVVHDITKKNIHCNAKGIL